MALHRGIQSALFYYLACTPCAEGRVRKRRKQETERNRVERAALEAHMPGLYVHPEPSTTNPYWQTEIEAGPIPSRTRKKTADMNRAGKPSSTRSNLASSVSIDASMSMERSDSALSGFASYQRNDESWGPGTSDIAGRGRPRTNSSSIDVLPIKPARAMLKDPGRSRSYNHPQNPALNDLHPPTTRKVQSKEEVLWMMQPPHVPEVMSGKTASQSSQSNGSAVHRPATLDQTSLRSNEPQPDERPSTVTSSGTQATDRTRDQGGSKFLTVPALSHDLRLTRSRTLPLRPYEPDQSQSAAHASTRKTLPTGQSSRHKIGDRRPPLTVKLPDRSKSHGYGEGSENDVPLRSDGLSGQAASRIQHDREARAAPKATVVSKEHAIRSSSMVETRMLVSAQDSADEHVLDALTTSGAFESWTEPDFELPQWIHDHTKREVRERWSFDI